MVMASRLLYGMAREGVVPDPFGRVHSGRRTPWVAIVFTTLLAVGLISVGKLDTLAQTTVLLLLGVFTVVNVSVLVLRREPVEHRHFVAPRVFPLLGIVISVGLLIHLVTQQNRDAFLIAARHPGARRRALAGRSPLLARLGIRAGAALSAEKNCPSRPP